MMKICMKWTLALSAIVLLSGAVNLPAQSSTMLLNIADCEGAQAPDWCFAPVIGDENWGNGYDGSWSCALPKGVAGSCQAEVFPYNIAAPGIYASDGQSITFTFVSKSAANNFAPGNFVKLIDAAPRDPLHALDGQQFAVLAKHIESIPYTVQIQATAPSAANTPTLALIAYSGLRARISSVGQNRSVIGGELIFSGTRHTGSNLNKIQLEADSSAAHWINAAQQKCGGRDCEIRIPERSAEYTLQAPVKITSNQVSLRCISPKVHLRTTYNHTTFNPEGSYANPFDIAGDDAEIANCNFDVTSLAHIDENALRTWSANRVHIYGNTITATAAQNCCVGVMGVRAEGGKTSFATHYQLRQNLLTLSSETSLAPSDGQTITVRQPSTADPLHALDGMSFPVSNKTRSNTFQIQLGDADLRLPDSAGITATVFTLNSTNIDVNDNQISVPFIALSSGKYSNKINFYQNIITNSAECFDLNGGNFGYESQPDSTEIKFNGNFCINDQFPSYVESAAKIQIHGNFFWKNGHAIAGQDAYGAIRIHSIQRFNQLDTTVEKNLFWGDANGGYGIHLYGGAHGTVITNNRFHATGLDPILVDGSHGGITQATISGNQIYGFGLNSAYTPNAPSCGIHLLTSSAVQGLRNFSVENNTVMGSGSSICHGDSNAKPAVLLGAMIQNNQLAANSRSVLLPFGCNQCNVLKNAAANVTETSTLDLLIDHLGNTAAPRAIAPAANPQSPISPIDWTHLPAELEIPLKAGLTTTPLPQAGLLYKLSNHQGSGSWTALWIDLNGNALYYGGAASFASAPVWHKLAQ